MATSANAGAAASLIQRLPQIQNYAAPTVMRLGDAQGQRSVSSAGAITADLTSPIVVGRVVLLQVDVDPNASYGAIDKMANPYDHYFWTVYDRDTNAQVTNDWSGSNRKRLVYPRAGHFRVECVYVNPRRGQTAPIKIEQDAVAEDPALAANLSSDSDYADAERQLVDDFKPYVESAAAGTGPLGITARFLAAVLREEIANTALLPGGSSVGRREGKITDVGAAIDKKAAGGNVDPKDIDRSLGVGQVKMSTAAMAEGVMTWTEQNPGGSAQRAPGRAQIDADFAKLSVGTLRDLLTILAWPKSNIAEAAKILAKLKNRPTRYPAMARADFGANARACQIIATEYNTGATNSAEVDAQPAEYGIRIWKYMSLPLMQKYFTNG